MRQFYIVGLWLGRAIVLVAAGETLGPGRRARDSADRDRRTAASSFTKAEAPEPALELRLGFNLADSSLLSC
jgi:hypothetical protein